MDRVPSDQRDEGRGTQAKAKQRGSLLGDAEDIARRKFLAAAAFDGMAKIWGTASRVSPPRRIRLYKALALPVLVYNSGTWGATSKVTQGLDTFHRRQLRKVIGTRWPQKIRNRAPYKKAGTCSVFETVSRSRVRPMGHVLRPPINSPAQRFMGAYYISGQRGRGRPRTFLPTRLAEGVNQMGHMLKTSKDLAPLRQLAADRQEWHKPSTKVTPNH